MIVLKNNNKKRLDNILNRYVYWTGTASGFIKLISKMS